VEPILKQPILKQPTLQETGFKESGCFFQMEPRFPFKNKLQVEEEGSKGNLGFL
jgi:hypothetical protein